MIKSRKLISVITILAVVFTLTFATADISDASTSNAQYWLKVNTQANVVTAYKFSGSKWKPVRAMLCSTGLSGNSTPKGTFYTKGKWNWGTMMNDVYAKYCTWITGDILFHSVYYLKKGDNSSQPTYEFNKLGSKASHGCVRLSTMDSKWVYENCKIGTKVTIYSSSKAGPLGKPQANTAKIGRYTYWDPTDPSKNNPFFTMQKPVIKVSSKKVLTIKQGSKYNLIDKVYAKDPNTFMSLTSYLKVSKVTKYSSSKKKYLKATFTTKKTGKYHVTYYVNDPYGRSAKKTITIVVAKDLSAPKLSGTKAKTTVSVGYKNLVKGLSAKQGGLSRTKAITAYVKAPGSKEYKKYSYTSAQKFTFTKQGSYTIKYVVKNAYSPYRSTTKIVKFYCYNAPVITAANQNLTVGSTIDYSNINATHHTGTLTNKMIAYITTPDNTTVTKSFSDFKLYNFAKEGTYTIKLTVKNPYSPYNTVTKTIYVNCANVPVITASDLSIEAGNTMPDGNISAVHKTGNITSAITAKVMLNDQSETMTYAQLMAKIFDEGIYTIELSVKDPYNSYKVVTKTITLTVTNNSN